jgi:hypothetical protein
MINDLLRSDRHDWETAIELLQTHISWVIVAGERVYKIKKPVNFGFVDYSTFALRKRYCAAEVELNRRLSRNVYLGVEPVVKRAGGHWFGGDGEVVEHAVVMRRLPLDRLMKNLLARGELGAAHLDAVADRLAAFYRAAAVIRDGRGGTPEIVAVNIRENFQQTEKYLGQTLNEADYRRIVDHNEAFLREHAELLAHRVTAGRIRDGHGDLHMEHICFGPGDEINIFDCIEFNERFRLLDVVCDVAFLAMDLDYHGRFDLAQRFLRRFFSVYDDPDGRRLLPLYQCYRAYVRGKVISFLLDDPSVSAAAREAAAARARRYFRLAAVYTGNREPGILLLSGISGSGKSHLAGALARVLNWDWLRSDEVRKEMLGAAPQECLEAAFGTGAYSDEITARTYAALAAAAGAALAAGRGVVVDATFLRVEQRRAFYDLAAARQVPLTVVACEVPLAEIERRIAARRKRPENVSDASVEVARRQLAVAEPPTAAEIAAGRWITHDTRPEILAQLHGLLPRLS